jgi:hypothetical protein
MAQPKESVVTPERFASGMTWDQWMASIKPNRQKFEHNYRETVLSQEDIEAFHGSTARPDGPAKILALAEGWCPDVFRGLPVMARIAEAGGLELRIFPRDQNLDIMDEFLKHGQHQSIPTFVFYTRDHRYLCHWIERPQLADQEMHLVRAIFERQSREEAAPQYEAFQRGPVWARWRLETVREIQHLLEEKCSTKGQ